MSNLSHSVIKWAFKEPTLAVFGNQDGGLAQYSYVHMKKPHTPVMELQ